MKNRATMPDFQGCIGTGTKRITGRTGAAGSVQLHEDNGSVLVITPDLIQWAHIGGQPVVSDLREWNKISENA